jgi:hypothetical protein
VTKIKKIIKNLNFDIERNSNFIDFDTSDSYNYISHEKGTQGVRRQSLASTENLKKIALPGYKAPYTAPIVPAEPEPVLTVVSEIQVAAGFEHVWDWNPAETNRYADRVGSIDVVQGTSGWIYMTGADYTWDLGVAESRTAFNRWSHLHYRSTGLDVSRTSDIFVETIIDEGAWAVGYADCFLMVGEFRSTAAFFWLMNSAGTTQVWNVSGFSQVAVISPGQGSEPILNETYVTGPTYISVAWVHSELKYYMWYRTAGQPETELVSAVQTAGTVGDDILSVGGNTVNTWSAKFNNHGVGIKRGLCTQAHRDNIYTAMGII